MIFFSLRGDLKFKKLKWTAKTKTIFSVKSDKQPKIFAESNGSRDRKAHN